MNVPKALVDVKAEVGANANGIGQQRLRIRPALGF
jgi:hypothetical protein